MSKTIGNDKAIEFNAEVLNSKKMIASLNSIGINTKIYEKELQRIIIDSEPHYSQKSLTDNTGVQIMAKATTELEYIKAISSLRNLQNEMRKYSIYFSASNYIDSVDIDACFTEEQLTVIAENIIGLLKTINASDTKSYASEKRIVERLYHFAYLFIKIELRKQGTSKVLNWAKDDPCATSFINSEVQKDLDSLSDREKSNPQIKKILASAKAQGLDFSYLNEVLILCIAIQNDDIVLNKVREELLEIIKELKALEKSLEKESNKVNILDDQVASLKQKLQKKSIVKDSIKMVASLSIIAGIVFGSYQVARHIIKTPRYMTTNDTYSISDNLQTPSISEYQSLIGEDDTPETYIIEYSPWERESFLEEFTREITTYDVSNVEYENLEDYLQLDLYDLGILGESETETKESLTPSDLYNDEIREVERIYQDVLDVDYEPTKISFRTIIIIYLIYAIWLNLDKKVAKQLKIETIPEYIKNFSKRNKKRKELKEAYLDQEYRLKEALDNFKTLLSKNDKARARFIELYQKYAPFLQDDELEQNYQRLIREKRKENTHG